MIFSNNFFKPLLLIISFFFRIIVRIRLLAYRSGWLKIKKVKTPVISVGNLSLGGTGKTPVVDFLAKEIKKLKKKPTILTRGYKRNSSFAYKRMVFSENERISPNIFGDEPFLLSQWNPEVPIYVGNSRFFLAKLAEKKDHPDFILLDDCLLYTSPSPRD